MKNIFIAVILSFFALSAGFAQDHSAIQVTKLDIQLVDETVHINLRVEAGEQAVKKDQTLELIPVLRSGGVRFEWPAIIINSRQAVSQAAGNADFHYTVPFERLHTDAVFELEGTWTACAYKHYLEPVVLAEGFVREGTVRIDPVYVERPLSTGDKLARQYRFVAHLDDFEAESGKDRNQFIADNSDRSLTVFFRQGKHGVERDFRGNEKSINDLLGAIEELNSASDSQISHVIIAGFASPEGTQEFNNRLAYERAVSLRDYLLANSRLNPEVIDIYNGAVDWKGLRMIVEESHMPDKAQVLWIIDRTIGQDNETQQLRHNELKALNQGSTYRYMLQYIFPELRNATYIRIYYENQ